MAVRNGRLEDSMIKLLREKWNGVFLGHRKKHEVMMLWKYRQPCESFAVASDPADCVSAAAAAGGGAGSGDGKTAAGSALVRGTVVACAKPPALEADGTAPAGCDAEPTWEVHLEDGTVEGWGREDIDLGLALAKASPKTNPKMGPAKSKAKK